MSAGRLRALAERLAVLSDPTRLLLFEMLVQGVQCNCDLGDALGVTPNLVSHHLGVLRRAGLVRAERDRLDGRWVYYSVDPVVLRRLGEELSELLDPGRLKPRLATCGPHVTRVRARGAERSIASPEVVRS